MAITEYTAHFVPCKVRYNGPTSEFIDNFQHDSECDEITVSSETGSTTKDKCEVTYVRGRKIVGKRFLESEDYQPFLVKTVPDEETSDENSIKIKKIAKVTTLIDYERDGNEERLHEELEKFQEFLKVLEIIHS